MGNDSSRSGVVTGQKTQPALLSDGRLIYVSQKRRQIVSAVFLCYALIFLAIAIAAYSLGSLFGVLWGTGALAWGAWVLRIPRTGLIVEQQGIKIRSPLWTYHYPWREVQAFELIERPISPYMYRLRVHLRDGSVRKVRGFFARGPAEEEKRRLMLRALEERLAYERGRQT